MIDEKNPVTSQTLSDEDLDGVVGGLYIINGVTYKSMAEMPDDVREEVEQMLAMRFERFGGLHSSFTCSACRGTFSKSALNLYNGRELCTSCYKGKLYGKNDQYIQDYN